MAKWFVVIVASIFAAVGTACARRSAPVARQLRVEGFAEVRKGMSQDEVERLLGGPPGNYGRNDGIAKMTAEGVIAPPGSVERSWCDDHNCFEVYFDAHGRVVKVHERFHYEQKARE